MMDRRHMIAGFCVLCFGAGLVSETTALAMPPCSHHSQLCQPELVLDPHYHTSSS
jgi:hypothetical protein